MTGVPNTASSQDCLSRKAVFAITQRGWREVPRDPLHCGSLGQSLPRREGYPWRGNRGPVGTESSVDKAPWGWGDGINKAPENTVRGRKESCVCAQWFSQPRTPFLGTPGFQRLLPSTPHCPLSFGSVISSLLWCGSRLLASLC